MTAAVTLQAPPLILAIESSCDETAAAVVQGGTRVLSNVIASQHDLHRPYGGVVPEIASRAHVERLTPVLREALAVAGVPLDGLSAIAVGHRPGLIGALLVGVSAAKALAWSLDLPLLGIDHIHAHLYAGLMHEAGASADADPPIDPGSVYPALGLVISGGHTSMYFCRSPLAVHLVGRTIDDAVGEAFDKVASILGLRQPGGPAIDRLARTGDDRAHDFPLGRLSPDSLDFTFSGLKTSVLYTVRGNPQPIPPKPGARRRAPAQNPVQIDASAPPIAPAPHALDERAVADVCASFQRAASRAIVLKLERALERLRSQGDAPRALLVGGGVSANSRIRDDLRLFARSNGLSILLPPMSLCTDNAAMLAGLAYHRFAAGERDALSLEASPMVSP